MRLPALPALAAIVLPVAAAAQSPALTHEPLVLRYPGGTRAAAMANAAIGVRDDEVLFYGPAQLTVARGASASWQSLGGADLRGVSAAFQSGGFGIGVGAQQLAYDAPSGLPVPPGAVRGSADAPASSTSVAVGLARTIKGFRLGAVGRATTDDARATRVVRNTLDLGVGRALGPVQVGVAVQHLGATATAGELRVRPPTQATVGFNGEGLPIGAFDLAGGASLSVQRDGRVVPRTGWELGWVWIEGHALQLRVGARRPEWDDQSWATLGLGLLRDNVSLDYAYEPHERATAHRIGVRVR